MLRDPPPRPKRARWAPELGAAGDSDTDPPQRRRRGTAYGGGCGAAADAGGADDISREVRAAVAEPRERAAAHADRLLGALEPTLQGTPARPAEHDLEAALFGPSERDPSRPSFLVLFAGQPRPDGLAETLRAHGARVVAIDKVIGGREHDVARPEIAARLLQQVADGDFDAMFMGTPCSSFSVAHAPQLRSRRQPLGGDWVPDNWRAYVRKHNGMAEWSARVATATPSITSGPTTPTGIGM